MLKTLAVSIKQAIENIRTNFFHTFLSILGIVIGVGALVTILSLIDGMEKYAYQQISDTTSLEAVSVSAKTGDRINGVFVRKDSTAVLTYGHYQLVRQYVSEKTEGSAQLNLNKVISIPDDTTAIGSYVLATSLPMSNREPFLSNGRFLTDSDLATNNPVMIVNQSLARLLLPGQPDSLIIGRQVQLDSLLLQVVGVIKNQMERDPPRAAMPISVLDSTYFVDNQLQMLFQAQNVEQVTALRDSIREALVPAFPDRIDDLAFVINESRVDQVAQGFLLFRLIMGMIVGVSVLVGGIGVMNVLLIAVTERTKEIGLRKAMGAKRRDVILQFLAEAITISALGSILGLLLGIVMSLLTVPIVKMIVEIPFQAAFTLGTMGIVALVAILIGIVFGTYPALRAARLDPVDAIRRE